MLRCQVRRPHLKRFEQVSGIGHLALDPRMRPVATPHQAFRVHPHQRFMKRRCIGIIGRVAADAIAPDSLAQHQPSPTARNRPWKPSVAIPARASVRPI